MNPSYKGEKLDIALAEGPIDDRRCTDFAFCVVFILALCAFGGISALAFIKGNPSLLV